jgi:hypothetical protein
LTTRARITPLLAVAEDVVVTLAVLFTADAAIVHERPAFSSVASLVAVVAFAADQQGGETDEESK